jgi:hypothetical protein
MINILISFISVFIISSGKNENLVVNGDFEILSKCPQKFGELRSAVGWRSPNMCSPDFYYDCDTILQNNVYRRTSKSIKPLNGKGFAGLVLMFDQYYSHQEYLQGQLKQELVEGNIYEVSFYIKFEEISSYFVEEISFALTGSNKLKYKRKKGYELIYSNDAITLNLQSGKDTSWVKMSYLYQAKGGEKYITIGMFGNTFTKKEFKKSIVTNKNYDKGEGSAYYYFDEVSVKLVE